MSGCTTTDEEFEALKRKCSSMVNSVSSETGSPEWREKIMTHINDTCAETDTPMVLCVNNLDVDINPTSILPLLPEPEPTHENIVKSLRGGKIPAYDKQAAPAIKDDRGHKLQRNHTCFCGSGAKYKKCCLGANK